MQHKCISRKHASADARSGCCCCVASSSVAAHCTYAACCSAWLRLAYFPTFMPCKFARICTVNCDVLFCLSVCLVGKYLCTVLNSVRQIGAKLKALNELSEVKAKSSSLQVLPPLARYTGRMCNLLEAAVKIQLQMFRSTKLITKAHTHTNTHAHIIRRINNNNTRRKKQEMKKKKKKRNSAKIIIIISKKNKLYTQPASKRNKNHKEAYAKERHKNKARTEELL